MAPLKPDIVSHGSIGVIPNVVHFSARMHCIIVCVFRFCVVRAISVHAHDAQTRCFCSSVVTFVIVLKTKYFVIFIVLAYRLELNHTHFEVHIQGKVSNITRKIPYEREIHKTSGLLSNSQYLAR